MNFPGTQVKKVLLLLRPEPQSELVAFDPGHLNTSHVLPTIGNEFEGREENFDRFVINIFCPCVKERIGAFKDGVYDVLYISFLLPASPEFSKPTCNRISFRC